jgi:hypothetical protein
MLSLRAIFSLERTQEGRDEAPKQREWQAVADKVEHDKTAARARDVALLAG